MLQLSIKRIIAFAIDMLIISLIFYGNIQVIMYAMTGSIGEVTMLSLGGLILANVVQVIYLFIYFIYIPVRKEGQTIGKQLLQLKEVNQNQTPLTIRQYFKRDVLLKFLLIPLTGGAILIVNVFLMSYQLIRQQPVRPIHDLVMKTTVLSTK